ncbi:hypothetical protein BgiBS90_009584, partial [Biomphalaria glabrata]
APPNTPPLSPNPHNFVLWSREKLLINYSWCSVELYIKNITQRLQVNSFSNLSYHSLKRSRES